MRRVKRREILQILSFGGAVNWTWEGNMRLCNYTFSPTRINNAKAKGKLYILTDGGGLFVEVSAAGLKTWRYQYRFGGARRKVTIGKYPESM